MDRAGSLGELIDRLRAREKSCRAFMAAHGITGQEPYGQMADDFEEAANRLEAGTVDVWQPFETAPKDGFPIIADMDSGRVVMIFWSATMGKWWCANDHAFIDDGYVLGWMPFPKHRRSRV